MVEKSYMQLLKEAQRCKYVKNLAYKRYGDKRRAHSPTTAFMKEGIGYFPKYETLDLSGNSKRQM